MRFIAAWNGMRMACGAAGSPTAIATLENFRERSGFWDEVARAEFLPRGGRFLDEPERRRSLVNPLTNLCFPCERGHVKAPPL